MTLKEIESYIQIIGPTGCWLLTLLYIDGGEYIGTNEELSKRVGLQLDTWRTHRDRLIRLGLMEYEPSHRKNRTKRFTLAESKQAYMCVQ